MGGGGGVQGRDPPLDLPGPVPARERDPVRPRAAHRQDRGHASRSKGEFAPALVPG